MSMEQNEFDAKMAESQEFLSTAKQIFSSVYTYFPFEQEWEKKFVPLLENERVKDMKKFILVDSFRLFNDKEAREYCHPDLQYDNLIQFSDSELAERLDKQAWGFLSMTMIRNQNDQEDLDLVQNHEYDDPNMFGHYLLMRNCHSLALLIYTLCTLAFPDKTFQLVSTSQHCFVICKEEPRTIYDFLWYKLNIPASRLLKDTWTTYDTHEAYIEKFWTS